MNYSLDEKKVLKKLGIEDFRHLTKDKVIQLASMLDKMDPEVAKKALEQFPDFSKTVSEIVTSYQDSIDKGLASNDTSVASSYKAYDTVLDALRDELKKEDLSFEQRKEILDKMAEIADSVAEKDSENKKFIFAAKALGGAVVALGIGVLSVALGGKIDLKLPPRE